MNQNLQTDETLDGAIRQNNWFTGKLLTTPEITEITSGKFKSLLEKKIAKVYSKKEIFVYIVYKK